MLPPKIAGMLKLVGKKNRQHYVFQRYLKAWAAEGNVWVRRNASKKAFHTATSNVAVERHFYKLQPVTTEDLALIRQTILNDAPTHVKERCELIIHNFTVPLEIKRILDPKDPEFEELSKWLDERIINAEEDLHCDVEACLVPALDDMLDGKTGFYFESASAQEFIHAIFVQYMRTKKMKQAFSSVETTLVPGADMKRCCNLYALFAAMRVADSIWRDRNQFKIVLLDNETDTPLITGDQPVINIHATFRSGVPPEKLELFYPLSPKRAMALLEVATTRSTTLTMNDVQQFNDMIARHSHEQVFSNSRTYLERLQMGERQ